MLSVSLVPLRTLVVFAFSDLKEESHRSLSREGLRVVLFEISVYSPVYRVWRWSWGSNGSGFNVSLLLIDLATLLGKFGKLYQNRSLSYINMFAPAYSVHIV